METGLWFATKEDAKLSKSTTEQETENPKTRTRKTTSVKI